MAVQKARAYKIHKRALEKQVCQFDKLNDMNCRARIA
jgi:hypothetical protein